MSVINPGELKERLNIHGKTDANALDENGFPVEGTELLFSLRCKKKTVSTKEFIQSDKAVSLLTYKFICRKRDIDSDMLIEYKNKVFDIKHVHEIDESYIEMTASESEESV